MARGRRDYTWGVLQDSILPGRYSANFFKSDSQQVPYWEGVDFCDYTVPAGYKLFLTAVYITTGSPAINWFGLIKDDMTVVLGFFSLNYVLNPGVWGSYVYEGGERMRVRCFNYDPKTSFFSVQVMGVLEELV